MQCNVAGLDRTLRGAVAVAAIAGLLHLKTPGGRIALGVIGVMASFTFLTRYCPANQLLGINTCDLLEGIEEQTGIGAMTEDPQRAAIA